MQKSYNVFENDNEMVLNNLGIALNQLKFSVTNFTFVVQDFHRRLANLDKTKYSSAKFLIHYLLCKRSLLFTFLF